MRQPVAILLGLIVAAVVVVAGMLLFRDRLDDAVADAIARHGSQLTGTAVTVGEVRLEPREGRATIHEVRIANPDGFSDRDAVTLGRLVLALDPATLTREPYVIEDLEVRDVGVLCEFDASARRNLEVIREHLSTPAAAEGAGAPEAFAEPPPRLIVDRLHLTGGMVVTDPSALGVSERRADLPGYAFADLGVPDGLRATGIARQALRRLLAQATAAAVDDELERRLADVLGEQLGGEPEDDVLDQLEDVLER